MNFAPSRALPTRSDMQRGMYATLSWRSSPQRGPPPSPRARPHAVSGRLAREHIGVVRCGLLEQTGIVILHSIRSSVSLESSGIAVISRSAKIGLDFECPTAPFKIERAKYEVSTPQERSMTGGCSRHGFVSTPRLCTWSYSVQPSSEVDLLGPAPQLEQGSDERRRGDFGKKWALRGLHVASSLTNAAPSGVNSTPWTKGSEAPPP